MEELGNQGKVEEARKLLKMVEELEKVKEETKQMAESQNFSLTEKKLRLCEVCGMFLPVLPPDMFELAMSDAETRIAQHFAGRNHIGYQTVRDKIEELTDKGV